MAWETHSAIYGQTNSPWIWNGRREAPAAAKRPLFRRAVRPVESAAMAADRYACRRISQNLRPEAHPGQVPASGHFPASAGPFALLRVVGPMARTVKDLKLLFEAIAGPDNGDPYAAPVPLRNIDLATLRHTRIGYYEDNGRTPVTPETRAAVQRAAQVLRDDGFTVDPFLPKGLDEALALRIVGQAKRQLLFPLRPGHHQGRESDMYAIVREISIMPTRILRSRCNP